MDVNGIVLRVKLQLKVGISPSSNGQEQMVAIGIVILAALQLVADIFPSSNGQELTDVNGIV